MAPHSRTLAWKIPWTEEPGRLQSMRSLRVGNDWATSLSLSSAFYKSSLNIWKFSVHVLLKPSLKDFEHYLASMWNEHNCVVVEHSLALPFFGIGMKTDLFQSCGHCWVFQICWNTESSTLTVPYFRIWNSSAGIPSPPLAFFVVLLPEAHLTSHSRMSGSRWGTTSVCRTRKILFFFY